MNSNRREFLLKAVALGAVGLFLLDRLVLEPVIRGWIEQGKHIAVLREKVGRGRQLLGSEKTIRDRWAEMLRANLPVDVSAAENQAFKCVGRWALNGQINVTNLTPQWQKHEDGFDTLECRLAATGDQTSIGRFIYELESDPMPVYLEECELVTRDPRGAQLTLTARMTFLRLAKQGRGGR